MRGFCKSTSRVKETQHSQYFPETNVLRKQCGNSLLMAEAKCNLMSDHTNPGNGTHELKIYRTFELAETIELTSTHLRRSPFKLFAAGTQHFRRQCCSRRCGRCTQQKLATASSGDRWAARAATASWAGSLWGWLAWAAASAGTASSGARPALGNTNAVILKSMERARPSARSARP
ncbi:uncharacterized protein LOC125047161 [Penaeus chinensis]|uniref:uncharacterized protein LOC125047161 n=1 Tax=Penaeus chinensis TaxID=139456 RepID=UPI001FB85848|nr:uncharacterized protein LOC125047161 [Penaeus chinensis]